MGTAFTPQTLGGKRLLLMRSRCQNLRGNLQHSTLKSDLMSTVTGVVEGVVRPRRSERQGATPAWQRRAKTACTNVSSTCAWTLRHRQWRRTLTPTRVTLHHKLRQRSSLLSKKLNPCVHNNTISDACKDKLLL